MINLDLLIFFLKDIKENKEFKADMQQYMTNFQISKMVPTNVVNGDKRDKKTLIFTLYYTLSRRK